MITTAPEIESLATLNHSFRHVATQEAADSWRWHGNLWEPSEFKIYRVMRDEHQTIVQLSYQPRGSYAVLFAAISKRIDPTTAYDAAVRFVDGAASRHQQAMLIKSNARRRFA